MKKILVIGVSLVDPSFFNTRVLKIDKDDDYHFTNILSKVTGIENAKVIAVPGAGNDWITSVVIDNLKDIDADTLVVINWAMMDRYDFPMAEEQDVIQDEIETCIPEEFDYLRLNRTYNLKGELSRTGLRWWPCSHFMFGPKQRLQKLLCYAGLVKNFFEKVVLVQKLLKEKGATQVHMMQHPPDFTEFRILVKELQTVAMSMPKLEPRYQVLKFGDSQRQYDLYERYPELTMWRELVDWSLFAKYQFDFFYNNNIPFAATDLYNNFHQPPINNYLYVKKVIAEPLGLPSNDLLEEMKQATVEHCEKYNCLYDFDDVAIAKALGS